MPHPILFAVSTVVVGVPEVPQQTARPDPTPTSAHVATADSLETLEALRSAQERFERERRHHLPWTVRTWGGRCDEIVGRFCFRHGNDGAWEPHPEDQRVTHARHRLLARLDSAAQRYPGDRWIAGQRIRYLTESRRYLDALWAARECRASRWWCDALTAFVHHLMTDFRTADSLFGTAIEAMPTEERTRWTDLTLVVDPDLRSEYEELDVRARETFNRRLWRLADPLYLIPGNERRTAHYARVLMDRLVAGTATPYGLRWKDDNRELVVRFGWTVGWERVRPSGLAVAARARVVGHHEDGARRFMPPAALLEAPLSGESEAWDLDPRYPRASYAPGYARRFGPLTHQLAAFRRGDSTIVVAAFDHTALSVRDDRRDHRAKPQTPAGLDTLEVGLVIDARANRTAVTTVTPPRTQTVVLSGTAPRDTVLVSVEALARADSVAARARYVLDLTTRPPRGPAVSDLLLLRSVDVLPRVLAEAIPSARGTDRYRPGEPVVLYWELYDVADRPHQLALTLVKEGKSFFRKAAELLGLAGERDADVTMEWEDPTVGGAAPVGRSVIVQLPEDEGRYTLRLEVTREDGVTAASEREIVVQK